MLQIRLRSELEANRLLSSGHTEGAESFLDNLVSNLPDGGGAGGGDLLNVPADLPLHTADLGGASPENSNLLEPVHRQPPRTPLPVKTRLVDYPRGFDSSSSYSSVGGGGPPLRRGDGVVRMMREVADESLRVLSELSKNGSQLLDVLTELAQLSSNTLTQSVSTLQAEVSRLENVRVLLSKGITSTPPPTQHTPSSDLAVDQESSADVISAGSSGAGDLRSLQNTTKTIFSIVEAIASNTGWIPYIFHNMQHVEKLANRTLELTQRVLVRSTPRWSRPRGPEVPGSGSGGGLLTPQWRLLGGSVNQSQALDLIYDTSVNLQRIMPALTKLVAEPEPLMALAGGRTSQEGRVEIYYKGQWGSACKLDMGHPEASAVCQYLGFAGGVWAGDGHFERGGDERHWLLNVSCVYSQTCPVVVPVNRTVDCPSGHFAVICDHMLRMTPIPGINDVKTGLVSIHHQGRWLPVCSHGWSGYEARVACKQMGFLDGREFLRDRMPWREMMGEVGRWVSGVGCTGEEGRLDACDVDTYSAEECSVTDTPAAVRCQ
ncbi:hypothetical protein ACOMHN_064922 [Nucella lapillus]